MAAPMPRDAPVTSATFLVSVFILISFVAKPGIELMERR